MTPRPLLLNAFDMLVPVHQSPGLWRHPESRAREVDRLETWTGLARTLEEGGFTALFLADVLGVYDVHGGSFAGSARGGVQHPVLDPLVIVPAMAAVTRSLGFGVTASVTYEHPYQLARTLATLDHLTDGRVGWNVVTSYQDSAARNLGLQGQIPHDERYDRADEHLEVMYKLLEGSFAPGAVVADADSGTYVDPQRVRAIGHRGRWFSVPGPALAHPGPQRTPLLFQAGASPRGARFAQDHAEAVFLIGDTPAKVRRSVDALRAGLAERGRSPEAIASLAMVTVVVGETDDDARDRLAQYRRYVDTEGALALFGGWTGVDLSGLDPDAEVEHVTTDANRSALAGFTTHADGRRWTVREVAEFIAIGGRGPVITGSPATVADELERWREESGVDGFNISGAVRPADLERFARMVSPELRRRGLLDDPEPGTTLRERVLGAGPWAAPDHAAAAHRWEG